MGETELSGVRVRATIIIALSPPSPKSLQEQEGTKSEFVLMN